MSLSNTNYPTISYGGWRASTIDKKNKLISLVAIISSFAIAHALSYEWDFMLKFD